MIQVLPELLHYKFSYLFQLDITLQSFQKQKYCSLKCEFDPPMQTLKTKFMIWPGGKFKCVSVAIIRWRHWGWELLQRTNHETKPAAAAVDFPLKW